MTKRTFKSFQRHYEMKKGVLVKRTTVIPATPRVEITCKECGRKHLVSEGQIKKCFHDPYAKSRRKRPKT